MKHQYLSSFFNDLLVLFLISNCYKYFFLIISTTLEDKEFYILFFTIVIITFFVFYFVDKLGKDLHLYLVENNIIKKENKHTLD